MRFYVFPTHNRITCHALDFYKITVIFQVKLHHRFSAKHIWVSTTKQASEVWLTRWKMFISLLNLEKYWTARVFTLEAEIWQSLFDNRRHIFGVTWATSAIWTVKRLSFGSQILCKVVIARSVQKISARSVLADYWLFNNLGADLANVWIEIVSSVTPNGIWLE